MAHSTTNFECKNAKELAKKIGCTENEIKRIKTFKDIFKEPIRWYDAMLESAKERPSAMFVLDSFGCIFEEKS